MKRKTFELNFKVYPRRIIYARDTFVIFKKHFHNALYNTGKQYITRLRRKKQILIKLKYNVR